MGGSASIQLGQPNVKTCNQSLLRNCHGAYGFICLISTLEFQETLVISSSEFYNDLQLPHSDFVPATSRQLIPLLLLSGYLTRLSSGDTLDLKPAVVLCDMTWFV